MIFKCPINELKGFEKNKKVFIVRMDKLPSGGGNKIPRFHMYLNNLKNNKQVQVISNPGSHTFYSLTKLIEDYNIDKLFFLERKMKINQYNSKIQEIYKNNSKVNISTNYLPFLYIQYLYNKYIKKINSIGIGGHVSIIGNPYENIFTDVNNIINNNKAIHILPVASGNMLDCFLKSINKSNSKNHNFYGIMTGAIASRFFLKKKYSQNKFVKLFTPANIPYKSYIKENSEFKKLTNINLDPNHTIQVINLLGKIESNSSQIVLWITKPYS